ncbi:MAG: motility protein A [Candidatus Cloacimonadota bacterium]|nr:motility protein A [Candidatus Cloacimonadota bacterium]
MDKGSVLGIGGGVILVVASIMMAGDIAAFISISSILVTIGGSLAAVLVETSLEAVINTLKTMKFIFFEQISDTKMVIDSLVKLADVSKREGLLALDDKIQTIEDSFLANGLILAVDGNDPDTIVDLMETEIRAMKDRHKEAQNVMNAMGKQAPAFGMIGTLIGLIGMLSGLDDPTKIGSGMAVALITTFYGAFAANLFFIPMTGKLIKRTDGEVNQKKIVIAGVLSIQMGENPRLIKRKLMTFLPPDEREVDEL